MGETAPLCESCKQPMAKIDGSSGWKCYTLGCPKNQIPPSG